MLMKKKSLLFIVVGGVVFLIIFYLGVGNRGITIKETTTRSKEVGDFILHIHIANVDEGIKVFSSLQYTGEGTVEVEHLNPLVSVVLGDEEHQYENDITIKQLSNGNIYHHPNSNKVFRMVKDSPCKLYFKAKFKVNNEEITIDHKEILQAL